MLFIETPLFTRLVTELISDDNYAMLQRALILRPETGDVIKHSGGLRKIRWGTSQRGKRGGLRVIYYWDKPNDTFYMLLVYKKNQKEDLTSDQLKTLSKLIKEWLK